MNPPHFRSPEVLVERDGGIATVILNRPEKLNATTLSMWQSLNDTMAMLDTDDQVRCIVIRGAGTRAFGPGNDISEFETHRGNQAQARHYGPVMHGALRTLARCRHPLVAMIHGICVGGGLGIASLCNLRICGESSRFGVPVNKLGLAMSHDEMGGLMRIAGPDVTLEMLLEGRVFGAQEALQKRIVSRVVADDEVEEAAMLAARRIADGAPLVARWHKRFVQRSLDPSPLSAEEYDEAFDCFATEDFQIGYQAFLAKRTPVFGGK
ncbi:MULTISPECIES: enoyl-CoA hydratase-related protein [unclassified Pseudomonas]|uniref:enoyl-CoA hydratase/isomerase family protein n=1 Tax=unclassified Pseudomonas TaxID=196821 RepID=UPI000D3A6BB1|nr:MULTISPECIES: enoyl-CoA hydratase-related protein [unclassified Pseudomonas]RAU45515.1 enoyl-CoA hydratase/isomerase family protein [Pseudomonas sp. RIT 409]RAU53101.1 enoyl-CoA hydratase/isomerase family protein [Pseudomonas sp. RIT 412]